MVKTTKLSNRLICGAAVILLLAGGAARTQEDDQTKPEARKVDKEVLKNPSHEKMTRTAPATFRAVFETSKGDFTIEVHRDWSPRGADRFYNLVDNGYYDDVRFFRVIAGFMAQFGIHGDPEVAKAWRNPEAQIKDDPVKKSNTRGMVTYAKTGAPDSRTVQIFINYADRNSGLDRMGFAPFGQVVEGMDVVDKLHAGYGEGAPNGKGPSQQRAQLEGNKYLEKEFPKLDYIKRAYIAEDDGKDE